MNPDLENERQRASFPVREMTYLIYGGKEKTELRERMQKLIENEEVCIKILIIIKAANCILRFF